MNQKSAEAIHRINYLTSELDALYHTMSQKLGISDSVSRILYTIYDSGNTCPLCDVYKKTGISKQTVNSAIRSLETDGVLFLVPYEGRSKKIVLTDKGEELVRNTAARLFAAEARVFAGWSTEETDCYLHLIEKFVTGFRKEAEAL